MKDCSGASQMDAKTQTKSLGVSMLDAAQKNSLEANVDLALMPETGGKNDRKLINVAIGAELNLDGTPVLAAAAAREAGNALEQRARGGRRHHRPATRTAAPATRRRR